MTSDDERIMSNNMAMTQALIVQLCNAGIAINAAVHEGYTYLCELLRDQGNRNTASRMALAATMLSKVAVQAGVHPDQQRAVARDMRNSYSTRPYLGFVSREERVANTVIVNGREKIVQAELSFDHIVELAGLSGVLADLATVTYRQGPAENPSGFLLQGEKVKTEDGMIFTLHVGNA